VPLFVRALFFMTRLAPLSWAGVSDPTVLLPKPALGRCTGVESTDRPPTGEGAPVDVRGWPSSDRSLQELVFLGYKSDPETGFLLKPDGWRVKNGDLAWLNAPIDLSRNTVAPDLFNWLQASYRLDEGDCTMRKPTGERLSRREYRVFERTLFYQHQRMALETLRMRLVKLPPDRPVPKELQHEVEEMAQAGMSLPTELAQLLAQNPSSRQLAQAVGASETDYARFFDGSVPLGQAAIGALPPIEGLTVRRSPAYLEASESRLGRLLSDDLRVMFSKSRPGRDLIAWLSDSHGRPDFPAVMVLKMSQDPLGGAMEAYFSPGSDSITLNHWSVVRGLLEKVAPSQKSALAAQLSDPKAVQSYLEAHPQARRELLDALDGAAYHELIHAWQRRRDRPSVESVRGNLATTPLEWEYEAFREQCRYLLTKAAANPLVIVNDDWARQRCVPMLGNFDRFEDDVKRGYLSASLRGNGGEPLSDVMARQTVRESTTRRLMGDDFLPSLVPTLKLLGFFRGENALDDFKKSDAKRRDAFVRYVLPELQAGALDLAHALDGISRPDLGLLVLINLPPSMANRAADERTHLTTKVSEMLLRPTSSLNLQDRIASYNLLNNPDNRWPPELWRAYWIDAAVQSAWLEERASATTDSNARAQYHAAAKQYGRVRIDAAANVAQQLKDVQKIRDTTQRKNDSAYFERLSTVLKELNK
jgi:hypothetical protein